MEGTRRDIDEREVTLSLVPPPLDSFKRSTTGEAYLFAWRIEFNGSTYSMHDFLSACLPYLDQIGETADNVRALRQIEGREFAQFTSGESIE